jgi:hypothetical protein
MCISRADLHPPKSIAELMCPRSLPSLCYDWYAGYVGYGGQLRVYMPLLTDVGISAVGQLTDLHVLALLSGACTLPSKHGSVQCVVEWEQGL